MMYADPQTGSPDICRCRNSQKMIDIYLTIGEQEVASDTRRKIISRDGPSASVSV